MKKFLIPVLLTLLIWSCSHKSAPSKTEMNSSTTGSAPIIVDQPTTSNTNTTSTTSSASTASTTTAGTRSAERTGTGSDAAAVAGQTVYNQKCNRCHTYKIPADYTVDRWISVMQVMAMKANLTDLEKQNVLAYVEANAKH